MNDQTQTTEEPQGFPLVSAEGVGPALHAAFEMAAEHLRPDIVTITEPSTGVEALVTVGPNGAVPISSTVFDSYRNEPLRRKGVATLTTLDSFIAHVNRYKNDDTVIFANDSRETPSLTAVLNYHEKGSDGAPRFSDHRSSFRFPLSDEWKAWNAMNAQQMSNVDFAYFLEDRVIDIMPKELIQLSAESQRYVDSLGGMASVADPAKLVEIATQLKVFENSIAGNVVNLSSGETQIEFKSEHTDATGQKLNLPTMFVIGIPVFKNGEPYQIIARFRYRKTGAKVTFWFELWRTDRVFDHAFNEAVERAQAETSVELMFGSEEVVRS